MSQARLLNSLNSLEFPPLAVKPTAVDDTSPSDASVGSLNIAASNADLGFWQCSPGSFKTARDGVNEVVLILEGRGTLISDSGERLDHQAGDLVLIPNGWSGVWEIHEHLKKYYAVYTV